MSTRQKIAQQMRQDWDRRVGHDYRFWMSDGHRDDAHMWETGERDFDLLAQGIPCGDEVVALEVGCGVGRLLRPAAKKFGRVVGFDVSQRAVDKARELLGLTPKIELLVGSGIDLQPVPDGSIDFVWSFAAITSMPTEVIASYLRDIRRVLKPTGVVRLQVYLGKELLVSEEDTLHLRCFNAENFQKGVEAAGFALSKKEELVLPFQVSFKELGIEAFVVTLEPTQTTPKEIEEIAQTLLPAGEGGDIGELSPSDLEAWMTVNYAEQLAAEGDVDKARQAIDYVDTYLRSSTIDTRDILDRIVSSQTPARTDVSLPMSGGSPSAETSGDATKDYLTGNLAALKERFPASYEVVVTGLETVSGQPEVRPSSQGPVIWLGTNCLDHADKPAAAAAAWVARSLQEKRATTADHLVVLGFGSGYHLENLLEQAGKKISCIEPDVAVLCAALGSRDLRGVLERLAALAVGQDQVLSFITPTSELLIRPQSMATTPEYAQRVKGIFYGKRGLKALHPKMAVLGPMEGGTLPIGQYTYSALMRAAQRVRGIDMSGFNQGYQLLDGFVSSAPRKNVLQATYFEMMSATILEALSEKPIDILICMAQAPISPRVLTELRKRGVITVLWFVEDYLRFNYWQQMAQHYDFIFTIQKGECLDKLKKAGAGEVHYLPTACDPNFHTPLTLTAEEKARWGSPISFVGAGYHNRQQMFASFANEPFRIWGSEWPMCKPFDRLVQDEARRISPEEYIKIFNATEVNLNLHSSTERDGVDPFGDFLNPRTFELASCEAFQLVDERLLLPEAFEVGKEIVTFRNLSDLREKIDYYLKHPEERTAIARRARARVLRDHTYDQRLQQMLSVIYASKFEQLRAKEDASPWALMLQRAKPYPELSDRCTKAFERGEEPMLDGLISDIVTGNGKLSETEQKLLFLFHVRKQIIRMTREESGEKQ